VRFDDEPLLEHPMDGPVQGAGAKFELTVGARFDVLDDGIAMPVAIGEREQDMKRDRGERQQGIDVSGREAHATTIAAMNIASMAIILLSPSRLRCTRYRTSYGVVSWCGSWLARRPGAPWRSRSTSRRATPFPSRSSAPRRASLAHPTGARAACRWRPNADAPERGRGLHAGTCRWQSSGH